MRMLRLLLVLLLAAAPAAAMERTGLPLPRFVSIKSDEVNVRAGPGTRYPIAWIYRREGWPVEIVEEFDHWRKIRDVEGAAGWVHKNMLSGERRMLVKGKEPRVLREDPDEEAYPVVKVAPLVCGKLLECQKEWCRVQVKGKKGWLKKSYMYGAYEKE